MKYDPAYLPAAMELRLKGLCVVTHAKMYAKLTDGRDGRSTTPR